MQRDESPQMFSDLASFRTALEAKHEQLLQGVDTSTAHGSSLQMTPAYPAHRTHALRSERLPPVCLPTCAMPDVLAGCIVWWACVELLL